MGRQVEWLKVFEREVIRDVTTFGNLEGASEAGVLVILQNVTIDQRIICHLHPGRHIESLGTESIAAAVLERILALESTNIGHFAHAQVKLSEAVTEESIGCFGLRACHEADRGACLVDINEHAGILVVETQEGELGLWYFFLALFDEHIELPESLTEVAEVALKVPIEEDPACELSFFDVDCLWLVDFGELCC